MVAQLAAISDDPLGEQFAEANSASIASVRKFALASSCCIDGMASGRSRAKDDQFNPIVTHARSKVGIERGLGQIPRAWAEPAVTDLAHVGGYAWSRIDGWRSLRARNLAAPCESDLAMNLA